MQDLIFTQLSVVDFKLLIKDAIFDVVNQLKLESKKAETESDEIDFVKISEAAKLIGFKKGYVYELCHKHKIPYHKVRGSLRFSKKELIDWIKAGRPKILDNAIENLSSDFIVNGQSLNKKVGVE